MAVIDLTKSSLKLNFETGVHPTSGAVVVKAKTFNNVKTDASADGLYAVAEAFAGLQELPLYTVERADSSEISAS